VNTLAEDIKFDCETNIIEEDETITVSTGGGIYFSMEKKEAEELIAGLQRCLQEMDKTTTEVEDERE
jgi:hypothetical protein